MLEIFKQKRELGLIPCLKDNKNEIEKIDTKISFGLILANHNPRSKQLLNELAGDYFYENIFCANQIGYGLYKDYIKPIYKI